jgi:hypothetical protein
MQILNEAYARMPKSDVKYRYRVVIELNSLKQ